MLNDTEVNNGSGAPIEGAPLSRLLLTDEQVASLLGVNVTTIRNLHRCGVLQGAQVGKYLRWHPADVQDYANSLRTRKGGDA